MDVNEFRNLVKPYTMTSPERINALYYALEYIRANNIKGDFVECGVWKGGNILGILKFLEYHNMTDYNVWLYDTFFGMTMPESDDIDINNNSASEILEQVLCMNSLEEVQDLLEKNTSYPRDKIKYVVGDICKTLQIKSNVPDKIALLRLDTDWYASTKIELEVLWEKVEIDAPCIIDDYGHWQGCKKAVDEFFSKLPCNHEFRNIDYTGVITYKTC
jgi:O-methyltransferase